VLERVCANRIAGIPVGKIVYTQWLNERGGIEADLTVTRIGELEFLIVTSAACQTRDFAWLRKHIGTARAFATDVTSGYAVLGLMGPRSRAVLSELTPADLSSEAFPFATSQEIELGYAIVRASRITYVGELGWELYIPTEFVQNVFDTLTEAGRPHGLRLAGYHALNSLRMEKAYRHWGHDITDEDTPFEAGLGFAVAFDNRDFIGREALLRASGAMPRRRLVQFAVNDPAAMLYHNEPVWRDGHLAGRITSGMYGHTVGRALGMGYVEAEQGVTNEFVASGRFEIEIACRRVPAVGSLQASYDPTHARVRDIHLATNAAA
jgi:4-methylaminobutanoate oxidase (formaldehyde-forming)